jgi:repressor LexA
MIEYMKLPEKVTKGRRVYLLEVKGDFFQDEFITNGDYVVIESTNKFKDGQIALVRLSENNVTLRRVTREKGQMILHPLNSDTKPKTADENNVKILGVVIAVFRNYLG